MYVREQVGQDKGSFFAVKEALIYSHPLCART
jgi:hypothetical protein